MFDIYIINIASEIVMSIILIFLLITCMIQRKRSTTIRALLLMTATDLALMVCQIGEWLLTMVGIKYEIEPQLRVGIILTNTLDYLLCYYVSLTFYNYIKRHIGDIYARGGMMILKEERYGKQQIVTEGYVVKEKWIRVLAVWGIVITLAYVVLMNQEWFFYIDENRNAVFHIGAYLVMYLLTMSTTVSSVVALIKHRKAIGRINFWLMLFYVVPPHLLVIFDLMKDTCITYLMMSLYIFVLYIYVDVRNDRQLAKNEVQIARQEKQLEELSTQIMLSQMQPHFLYNTLTTISSLCYIEGAAKAKRVVDKFSDYFRENLDAMGKERYISFEKELQHIETYLWLEQIRFEGALSVEYDIQVSDFRLPSLAIQPLVENAVKHGIRKKKGGGTVKISTQETESEYQITIEDDGAGYDVNAVQTDGRSHIGIENVRKRLDILCGGSCDINSVLGAGTIVRVHIPKNELKE